MCALFLSYNFKARAWKILISRVSVILIPEASWKRRSLGEAPANAHWNLWNAFLMNLLVRAGANVLSVDKLCVVASAILPLPRLSFLSSHLVFLMDVVAHPAPRQETGPLPTLPRSQLFQNAENFDIVGGQFVSGDVHYHTVAATPAVAQTQRASTVPDPAIEQAEDSPILPIVLQPMGEYTEIEIYCSQMLRRRRGFPLYVPEPSPNLPAEYQRNGITIGDVGRVTPDGAFDFFFNIYLPAEHPVNAHTPDGFVPLALYDMIDLSRSTVTPGDYVTTPFVQHGLGHNFSEFPGGAFLFNCFKPTGAILALPDGARREELVNLGAVRQYVVENAENWYRYVNGTRGRELKNGSLYLVTGWEKCKSWGMASFHDIVMPRNELQLTFRPSADMSSGYQYRWQTCPARHKHADPSPVGGDCLNQTVFIRGFSISLGETFWQKFFRGTSMRSITDAQLPNSHGSFVPFGFQGSALSWALNFGGSSGAGGRMHTESDEVILSDLSAASEIFHPSRLVNSWILQQVPNAAVVMSHDDEWAEILYDDPDEIKTPVNNVEDFIGRLAQEFAVSDVGGTAFLVSKKSESADGPDAHIDAATGTELFEFDLEEDWLSEFSDGEDTLDSDSASEPGAFFQWQSDSDLGGGGARLPTRIQHLWDERSELTSMDSFTTLREKGRALETREQIVSATSSPNLASTASLPDTVSERHSALTTSPQHTPGAGLGSSAAVQPGSDGVEFGFDADWDSMQRGIRSLDMSDIAVHSPAPSLRTSVSNLSSLMQRRSSTRRESLMPAPDTFTAAVREWGGEKYESQRKHWTFRKDPADGLRGSMGGSSASNVAPVESSAKGSMSSESGGNRPKHAQWRGMSLNEEEIWTSSLVGAFKVRRIELRPLKPQQRVTIDPFRLPTTIGPPKPPHDGAYTNIHKHSKVLAFSIHRHYKPGRVTLGARPRPSQQDNENRRPTAMILLAPRHVQEAYTSSITTRGLRSHGLLDTPHGRERMGETRTQPGGGGTGITSGSRRPKHLPDPTPKSSVPDGREGAAPHRPQLSEQSSNSLGLGPEREWSRTTHSEAFSAIDATLIGRLTQVVPETSDNKSSGVFSIFRRRQAKESGPSGVYYPPWVTFQNPGKPEERNRRHSVLSNSFEGVGLLPPKKITGRSKNPAVGLVDIFAQVPSEALFMILPLWPGPADPMSEQGATRPPHEVSIEQRQYLLVAYKPTDEAVPTKKHKTESGRNKKWSLPRSSTSSSDNEGGGRGVNILLTSYAISARLVSHADLQGSGVRVPEEGLAVLGPWEEAYLTMPPIATRDHGLLAIGVCVSREAGIQFDPEGLLKMGLCVPSSPAPGTEDGVPVAELTPIGKAVLEMMWIGGICVSSFGPAAAL